MRRFVLAGFVFLLALGLLWINTKPDGWDARLEPSPATRTTFAGNPEFGEYIALTRSMIQEATAHLDDPPTSETIELRLPFNLAPDPERCPPSEEGLPRRGALFIHGLYDSPFLVADAARAFQARCYLARAVLLPGHGTIAGDLTQTELAEWMAALDFGLKSFEDAIDGPLVLVGYSTGGALAVLRGLEEQAEQGGKIDAIVGLAPGLHGPFELGRVRQFLGQLAWNFPRFQYISIHPAIDPIKYESFAFRAGYQYVKLQNRLGDLENGPKLTIPFIATISDVDRTVPASHVLSFFCNRVAGPKRFYLYTEWMPEGQFCDEVIQRPSAFPDYGVLELTHVGIAMAPSNPVYGSGSGAYKLCLHYSGTDRERHAACMSPGNTPHNSEVRYAEPSQENLHRQIIRRGTFNPDFDNLMKDILDWLDATL